MRTLARDADAANSGITLFVRTRTASGRHRVHHAAVTPGPVTVTLEGRPEAAEAAVATVPQGRADGVAIQPSTATSSRGGQPGRARGRRQPTRGRYPPGSTFKIITATAAFQSTTLTPASPQACPGTTTIEGTMIHNEGSFDLGRCR